MKFGIFYEHQLPRAAGADWDDDAERRLYQEALEQIELADRVGIDYVWEVEHHFLEEASPSENREAAQSLALNPHRPTPPPAHTSPRFPP